MSNDAQEIIAMKIANGRKTQRQEISETEISKMLIANRICKILNFISKNFQPVFSAILCLRQKRKRMLFAQEIIVNQNGTDLLSLS